ncbi:MAG: hypothetical protein WCK17_00390 [Verrucomicrobiota bacterium]
MFLANINAFKSVEDLHKRHQVKFCQWLRDGKSFDIKQMASAAGHVLQSIRQPWLGLVAEEWLCSQGGNSIESAPDFLADAQPFIHGPRLAELQGLRAAVSVIPLDKQPLGAMARIWVVSDASGQLANYENAALEGGVAHFPQEENWRFFMGGADPKDVKGQSWELGATLAREVLKKSGAEAFVKLAAQWMVTGRVSGESVEHVGLGTKVNLAKDQLDASRNWLLPSSNEQPAEEAFQSLASLAAGRLHFAHTVQDAWSHITGEGTEIAVDQDWPTEVEELHGFVSDATGPFLAIILQTQPKRVVLWVTKTMKRQASELRGGAEKVFKSLGLPCPRIDEQETPEFGPEELHLLNATQRALARDPSLGNIKGGLILFNNTGGLFLHRAAALQRAQLNPRIWLAYRDWNNGKSLDFTLLRQSLGRMLEGRLKMRPMMNISVDWQSLINYSRFKPQSRPDSPNPQKDQINEPTEDEQISKLFQAANPEFSSKASFNLV